jgi:DNA polymerase-4
VGEQTYQALLQLGIQTIGDLALFNLKELEDRFGRYGLELHHKAHGIHHGEVVPYYEAKSISTENTFEEDSRDIEFLMTELVRMTEKIAYELRSENKMAGCIAVKIRYPDFETNTRQTTMPYTFCDDELIPKAKELFNKLYRQGEPIRLLGVKLSELTDDALQTNLFDNIERKTGLYKAIDDVKNRFGRDALTRAGTL